MIIFVIYFKLKSIVNILIQASFRDRINSETSAAIRYFYENKNY